MHNLTQRYRYTYILLVQLVKTDFKLRYQSSVLGYLWSLLRPLFLFVILYIVFAKFLKIGDSIPYFPQYLLLGILLWNFFAEVTAGSVGAIVGKGDLLRKINFPKYVIIIASSFSALINLALNFFVIAFFILLANIDLSWHALLIIPLLIELFVFSVGIAFLLSALFVRFRDVAYIWEVVLQAGFYATPVLYPVSLIPEKAAKILMLNPVAQIIQDARWALITPETQTLYSIYNNNPYIYIIPVGATVLIAFFSSLYFRKRSKYFAEEV